MSDNFDDNDQKTPSSPQWLKRLAPRQLITHIPALRQCTLTQLEDRFADCVIEPSLQHPAPGVRRERPYSLRRTFWCFIWQMLNFNTSCREVVRQLQAMLSLHNIFNLDEGNSAYIQARQRIPAAIMRKALQDSARAVGLLVAPTTFLRGRALKAIDGSTLTMPDTPENQAQYPQPTTQKPGCGFPIMRLSVLFCLRSGAVLQSVEGNYCQNEMRLFRSFQAHIATNDIVVYDRAAGNYVVAATVKEWSADLISRSARKIDFRKGKPLGKDDRLVTWGKTKKKPAYLSQEEWDQFPEEIVVRVIRITVSQKGFRTRKLMLVTTLLDPKLYPAQEIAQTYLRRWRLEMCLDDLKTTLGMESLKCQSPQMVEKELLAFLIAHNLTRCVMAQAAREHGQQLDRISFKGALDAFRHFGAAISSARGAKARARIWQELLRTLADDLVPERPNRYEPRAVKKRPKPYPLLNQPRRKYRDFRHKNS